MSGDSLSAALSDKDLNELVAWRHEAHRRPELSREESGTAARVVQMLAASAPDRLIEGLGGHGVAAVFEGVAPGPTVMLRSELDALPIQEQGDIPHRSLVPGKAHLCGHDGHSAILLGVAKRLSQVRPPRGRVVLLFQPAEEDGSGAAAVVADERYQQIRPDFAFALHNKPGVAQGAALLAHGPANCASRGICIRLSGSTAHASQPEAGRSPMRAVSELMPALEACGARGPLDADFAMVTVTHVAMGARAYGVAPGEAEILATLRTVTDDRMAALCDKAERLAAKAAETAGLALDISYDDVFLACTNDPTAVGFLRTGLERAGLQALPMPQPQRASEDFGRFGASSKAAMLFLGAGKDWPQVHTPTYDFPDALIPQGVRLFVETLNACVGENA